MDKNVIVILMATSLSNPLFKRLEQTHILCVAFLIYLWFHTWSHKHVHVYDIGTSPS